MLNIFNKTLLTTCKRYEERNSVCLLLSYNKIDFKVKKITFGFMKRTNALVHYQIFVRKQDYQKAFDLIYSNNVKIIPKKMNEKLKYE